MKFINYLSEDHIERFANADEDIKILHKLFGYKYITVKVCSTCKFSRIRENTTYCGNKDIIKKVIEVNDPDLEGVIDKTEGILVHIFGHCLMYKEE